MFEKKIQIITENSLFIQCAKINLKYRFCVEMTLKIGVWRGQPNQLWTKESFTTFVYNQSVDLIMVINEKKK